MQPHDDKTRVAVMEDGSIRTLTFEEWQPIDPSAYVLEAGAWCVAKEDDAYYFVTLDGRVDIYDEETGACVQEAAGVDQEAHDAYWRIEAAAEEAERRSE